MDKADWIWRDGEMIAWDDAQVHLLTHSLHYGLAVFEGIRCYAQADGSAGIFRLKEHIDRLYESAHIGLMEVPLPREEVVAACRDVIKKNGFSDGCYLRPIIYIGTGAMGIAALSNPVHVSVAGWRWGAYLGEEGVRDGIRTMISSYRRGRPDTFMAKGKICGQYVTSILAKREALKMGFEEAIMLDTAGLVAEGTGENIFIAKNGGVRTPWLGSSILGGITRETSLQLLRDQGIVVKEDSFTRDELYTADEIFMTGPAAEVTPVREVDGRSIGTGKPGPITKTLQEVYGKTVRGEVPQYASFIDRVEF